MKRGGGQAPVELASVLPISDEKLDVVTALDDALRRLEEWDPRQSRILEQRYFGGLSLEETAAALGVSLATVKRELRSARAWLSVQIRQDIVL
jgi:RNA polymerase sigma factor (sigma-70 family)